MPKRNINDNPIQSHYDDKFNSLKNTEKSGSFSGSDDKSGIDGVRNAEANPEKGYINNVVGKSLAKPGGPMAFVKQKSPIMAIIGLLVAGGIGIGGLISPAFLTQSIMAKIVDKFNLQETSMTIRTNKLFASKMTESSTVGSCTSFVTIFCRFSTPSNRFLKQLEKNGITAIGKDNEPIVAKGLFNIDRPASYKYTNSVGKEVDVSAKQLYSTLKTDAEFRTGFHNASMTRFQSLADEIFMKIKMKFGFTVADRLNPRIKEDLNTKNAKGAVTSAADSLEGVIEDSSVVDKGVKDAIKAGGATAADALTEAVTEEAKSEINKTNKGVSAITKTVSLICSLSDTPGLITRTVRGFQMMQLIKYSAIFLTVFGAIKAGDATPEEVSAVGDTLTQVTDGKSAMDSFGMNYVINNDTSPTTDNFQKYAPGAAVVAGLAGIMIVTNNPVRKKACDLAGNPVTGGVIDTTLAVNGGETLGASLGAAVVDMFAGYALGKAIDWASPWFIDYITKLVPIGDIMNGILGTLVGDLTTGLSGESVGDALVSGAGNVMGQTANQGGNMPLSVSQAIAYNETTKQVQLAYAEEDRATKSPFDISSPNTMMGSIVQKLIPYYASSFATGSVLNILGTAGKMVTSSFGAVFQPLTADATSATGDEYKLCNDPELKDNDVAAGPYCNIIYGVPPEYLDKDPLQVVKELIASGDINENGEPIDNISPGAIAGTQPNLKSWMELCTDGKSDQANNCKITDATANFALYTIDHRIQVSMDEEPSTPTSNSSGSGTADPGDSSQPSNTKKDGSGWTLKDNTDYSNVPCATGTTDLGVFKTAKGGITLKVCQMPDKLTKVNSLISKRTLNMINAADKDGIKLKAVGPRSSFRSIKDQESLRADNCHPITLPADKCSPPTALPGYSEHEKGLAVDFENISKDGGGKTWNWMKANAGDYGFINLPSEGWHWATSGG